MPARFASLILAEISRTIAVGIRRSRSSRGRITGNDSTLSASPSCNTLKLSIQSSLPSSSASPSGARCGTGLLLASNTWNRIFTTEELSVNESVPAKPCTAVICEELITALAPLLTTGVPVILFTLLPSSLSLLPPQPARAADNTSDNKETLKLRSMRRRLLLLFFAGIT